MKEIEEIKTNRNKEIKNSFFLSQAASKIDYDLDFDAKMNCYIKYYLIISFVSLFGHYLGNVCLNVSAERQIKKMRYSIFFLENENKISVFN